MKRFLILIATFILSTVFAIGCTQLENPNLKENKVKEIDLSQYKDSKPERKMKLLFIHHSCGGQWLADKGQAKDILPDTCIIESHPNGGGLRTLLQQNNYEIHEAAYKSSIGDKTDVCDWNIKFRDKMENILKCDMQDSLYKDATSKNDIIMFKSCFPANAIDPDVKGPGDPNSPVQTISNYKAAYNELLGYFRLHPKTLFVCVTAPPLVESSPNRLKEFVKRFVAPEKTVKAMGERARGFNNWLKDTQDGWLAGYKESNVVVFDYYDVLTKHGKSNHALYPTKGGNDSHPSTEGNTIATREFVPFLNRAITRLAGTY
jgi:hypothetical protein